MTDRQSFKPALEGVKVIEVTKDYGALCGKLMADMGADVIKVEAPGGDASRRVGPYLNDMPDANGSLHFWHHNTSKRGITLDIDTSDGQSLLRLLLEKADVFIAEYHPSYWEARGLSYERLTRANSRLVFAFLSPFGSDGPWAEYRSSDLVSMALGGPLNSCGYDDSTLPPMKPGGGHAGHTLSHFAMIAIMAALFDRERSGLGQKLDCSAHAALAATVEFANVYAIYLGQDLRRQTGRHAWPDFTPPTQFVTKDGRYVNAMGLQRVLGLRSDQNWIKFVDWLDSHGMAGELTDPSYANPEKRMREDAEWTIADILGKFCATQTAAELYSGAQSRGMQWGVVRSPEESMSEAQFVSRDFPTEVQHPHLAKTYTYPGAPYKFTRTPWRITMPAPLVGEHNVDVLCGELGLSQAEVALLAEMRVI